MNSWKFRLLFGGQPDIHVQNCAAALMLTNATLKNLCRGRPASQPAG